MSTQTLLTTEALTTGGRKPRIRMERVNWSGTIILILCAITVLLPLYVTISMAFKTTNQAVDGNAFSLPAPFSIGGFTPGTRSSRRRRDLTVRDRGTVLLTIVLAAFASYAIVRNWDHRLFRYSFFYLLAAMFIPFPVSRCRRSSSPGSCTWTTRSGDHPRHDVPAELQRAAVHRVPAVDPARARGERASTARAPGRRSGGSSSRCSGR
jgi:hypothetical protein